MDIVVDQQGINKISDPKTQFDRIKIEPKAIKVQPYQCRNFKFWAREVQV
jgi:hypothetical protein